MFFSDFWLPFSMLDTLTQVGMGGDRLHDRGSQWLMAAGRLRKGVGEKAAASEIEGMGKRLSAAYPATNSDREFHVERAGQVNPGFRKMILVFFLILLGVSTLILCTACANVANLLLARASARQKEIATRLATTIHSPASALYSARGAIRPATRRWFARRSGRSIRLSPSSMSERWTRSSLRR
jgi:putative ABC transport system permease protein